MPQPDLHPQLEKWLAACFKIGVLAFGGAGRMLMFREAVVENLRWLSADEFQEVVTVTTLLPGSNLVNFTAYVGFKFFGNLGALLGVLALCLPGALMALLVIWFLPMQNQDVQRVFQGFSIGSLTLFIVYIAKLISGLKTHHSEDQVPRLKFSLRLLVAGCIVAASFLNIPYLAVVLLGIILCLLIEFFV